MIEVVANLVVMVKTNTKVLCKDIIKKLKKYWTGGSYLVSRSKPMVTRAGHLLILSTSITHRMFYILLLQTTTGKHRQVFIISVSILTSLLIFPLILLSLV